MVFNSYCFCDLFRFLFILFPAFRYLFIYHRKTFCSCCFLWFCSVFVHFVPRHSLFIRITQKKHSVLADFVIFFGFCSLCSPSFAIYSHSPETFLFLSCVSLQLGSFTRLNTRVGKLRRWWAQRCRVTPPLHQLITAKLYKSWKVIGKNSSGCISTIPFPKVFAYFHSPYPMFCPFPAAALYFLYFLHFLDLNMSFPFSKPNSWTYNFVEVSGHVILRVLRLEVSVYNVYITN